MTRDKYLHLRSLKNEEGKSEILREYYNLKAPTRLSIEDHGSFFMAMYQYIEDYPFATENIEQMYPQILEYFDKKFNINFLIKDYGGEGNRVLFLMF